MIAILMILGGALFIGGIYFIIRGIKNSDDTKIVPLSDLKEIKEFKEPILDAQVQNQKSVGSLEEYIIKQNFSEKKTQQLKSSEKLILNEDQIKKLKEDNEQLSVDISNLKDALEREVASKKNLFEQEESNQIAELKKALEASKESIERLTVENHRITKLLDQEKTEYSRLEESAIALKTELRKITEQEKPQIEKLEEKIRNLIQEKEALSNSKLMLDKVMIENQELLFHIKDKESQISKQNEDFKTAQSEYELKLNNLRNEQMQLKEQLNSHDIQQLSQQLSQANQIITQLKQEETALFKTKEDTESRLQQIKKINDNLLEREKFLHYELAKSRAQVMGLERFCEDFKEQLEQAPNS